TGAKVTLSPTPSKIAATRSSSSSGSSSTSSDSRSTCSAASSTSSRMTSKETAKVTTPTGGGQMPPPDRRRPPGEPPAMTDDRETWGKKVDFLLSVIGFAVDLANFDVPTRNYSSLNRSELMFPGPESRFASAASEYFNRAILELHRSQGLHDLGAIKWDIAICLLTVYIICYFSLWKGISTSGKVVWFTALFPYAVLLILFVRGITLPGSAQGIKYYLKPDFSAIGSAEFGGSEAIITALSDEFPKIGRNREIFVACLFTLYFLVGLASCTQGGFYFFHLLDRYAAGYSMLFAVFFESITVSWIYGTQRFCDDIRDMIGFAPGYYWRFCWKFAAPAFLLFIIVYGLLGYEPLTYEKYVYPSWANALGWAITGSSVIMIPGVALYMFLTTRGSCLKRLKILTTPYRDSHMSGVPTDTQQQSNGQIVQSESLQVRLATTPDDARDTRPVDV
ncbi:unnamed protein product, partial [Acanthoscelides obtectus]